MDPILYKAIFDHIKSPVAIVGPDGIIDTNKAFLDLLALPSLGELLASPAYAGLVRDLMRRHGDACPDGVSEDECVELISDARGRPIRVSVAVSPVDAGRTVYLLEFRPSREEALYGEMSMQAAHTRDLFGNSPDGIVIVDGVGRVMDANPGFEAIFGWTRQEALGKNIDELVVPPEGRDEAERLFARVLAQEKMETLVRRVTKGGEYRECLAIAYPVVIDRRTAGNYVIYKDLSRERRAEKLLHEKEQFFSELFHRSIFPIAILDGDEIILDVNKEFETLFGWRREELIGRCINAYLIPPGMEEESGVFRERVFQNQSMASRTRRRNKAGELIEVEAVGSPVIIDGEVAGMFAMYQDVRPEARALEELRRERAFFRQLFDNTPNPVAIIDRDETVLEVNGPFERCFGWSDAELRGERLHGFIVEPRHQDEAGLYSRQVVEEGRSVIAEVMRRSRDGISREYQLIAFPVRLDADTIGAYVVYQDISERRRREREIRTLLETDALTGLYSRRHAWERLAGALSEASAGGPPLSLVYMDLDRFKEINDALGHRTGDSLLVAFAARLSTAMGDRAILCRIGGDEFLGILRGADIGPIIGELRLLFAEPLDAGGVRLDIQPSLGWASYPEDGGDPDALVSRADSRMYADKRLRRMRANPERVQLSLEQLAQPS